MIYNKLQKFGRDKGWYRTESSIFGNYKGFLVNIFQGGITGNQFKLIICQTEPMLDSRILELQQILDDNKKIIKFNSGEVGSDFISIYFREDFSSIKAAKLDETLDFIIKILSDRHIKSVISTQSALTHYNLSGKGYIFTQNQFLEYSTSIEHTKTTDKLSYHSYLNGFFGSWVYSMPIIILWVLLAYYLETLSTGLGIIIAFAGSYGYEKFNGKIGFWTKWLLILSNVLVIFLANIAVMAFTLGQAGVPVGEMLNLFNVNPEVQNNFKTNLFISLILGIIGWLQIAFSYDLKGEYIEEAKKL
jgi:hypothetical protein